MVNEEYKNIFIHIPKTAGTSMEKMKFVGYNPHILHHTMKMLSFRYDIKKYFKWCFVRNPLDRLVSAYHWGIKNHKEEHLKDINSFSDFIDKIEEFYDFDEKSHWIQLRSGVHVIPQYLYIEGFDMDYIGKFENLSSDWERLCREIEKFNGLENLFETLPQTYKTNHNSYEGYYTQKEKEKIYDLYNEDFKRFKYII